MKWGILIILFCLTLISRADSFDSWSWRYPIPPGDNLTAVTFGNGQFVAVGDHGMIAISTDGTNWVHHPLGTDVEFTSVVCGNGLYVAVGLDVIDDYAHGAIFVSTNGVNWKSAIDPETIWWLQGVAFGGGKFVASGISGNILTSSDGLNWIPSNNSSDCCSDLQNVCYGNGQFVVAQVSGAMIISTDSLNWTEYSTGAPSGANVQFGNGYYVASSSSGKMAVSTNGIDWTNFPSSFQCIGFANGKFIANDGSTSQDGSNWTAPISADGTLAGAAFGNGIYLAVGNPPSSLFSVSGSAVFSSSDGTAWSSVNSETYNPLAKIIYNGNQFVAVGNNGAILTSSNGINYFQQDSGTANNLNAIACKDGLTVAGGDHATMLISSDAINWISIANLPAATNDYSIWGMAYGNRLLVAVGDNGTILTSQDATNWAQQISGVTDSLRAVARGCNGNFIADGDNGDMLISSDGTNWNQISMPTTDQLGSIAYGNGTYVILGADFNNLDTDVFISSDGIHWTNTLQLGAWINCVAYGNGQFVAVGTAYDAAVEIAPIYSSTDGINWTLHYSGTTADLFDVTYGNGVFEAAGDFILESQPTVRFRSLIQLPDKSMLIKMEEPSNSTNLIQVSTDLSHWTDVTNLVLSNSIGQFEDPLIGNSNQRFYRAIVDQ